MKTFCFAAAALSLAGLLLTSCGRDAPSGPTVHSITGPVLLKGYLLDENSRFLGNKLVADADGVRVQLLYGNQVVAETLTENGIYRFTGISQGGYMARTRVIDAVSDDTQTITVANYDVVVTDTLRLTARGDLTPVPNPIGSFTQIYFDIADSAHIQVDVQDLSGNLVRRLTSRQAFPGLNAVNWDGRDASSQPARGDIFWVVFRSGFDERAHLLFR